MARTDQSQFKCPICGYSGLFADHSVGANIKRKYAFCPRCGAAERHRLQSKVLDVILPEFAATSKSALHFAPETFFVNALKGSFGSYKTSDLFRNDTDIRADICDLPLPDASVDFVYASHVLEHVPDDRRAIAEIYRILRPGGIAILPVPIYSTGNRSSDHTVEYGRPRKEEEGHVRAPGLDYFDRYLEVFEDVRIYCSEEFPVIPNDNQLYIRAPSGGPDVIYDLLPDYVPVCRKSDAS
jgi:SAM-dependent methyltransferase